MIDSFNQVQDKFFEKYDKLFFSMANGMYDEDFDKSNLIQNLRLKALSVVQKYAQDFGDQEPDFWIGSYFAKWLKTCLWNYRNTQFTKFIEEKKRFQIKGEGGDRLEMGDISTFVSSKDFHIDLPLLSEEEQKFVKVILQENDVLSEDGKVLVNSVARHLNIPRYAANKILEKLKRSLNDYSKLESCET